MREAEEKKPARQRILDTAAEMFYRDGIRAVGIDTIIARSGVAKIDHYRNFPSKDALVTASTEDRNRFFWRRWDKAEASRAGGPRRQLEAILDMIAATASHPKWRGCPFLNTATEFPEPDHPARAVILAHKRVVRTAFARGRRSARRDPDLLAEQLQLLIDGAYAIGQNLGPDGPARTVASAGRVLIAKAIAGSSQKEAP